MASWTGLLSTGGPRSSREADLCTQIHCDACGVGDGRQLGEQGREGCVRSPAKRPSAQGRGSGRDARGASRRRRSRWAGSADDKRNFVAGVGGGRRGAASKGSADERRSSALGSAQQGPPAPALPGPPAEATAGRKRGGGKGRTASRKSSSDVWVAPGTKWGERSTTCMAGGGGGGGRERGSCLGARASCGLRGTGWGNGREGAGV